MSGEKVYAGLPGYQQVFPEQLDKLNELYDRMGATGAFFKKAGSFFGYDIEHTPKTEDGYHWFWGVNARLKKGVVAVLFPWAQDSQRRENLRLDRSIAVYVKDKVSGREVKGILEQLCQCFLKKEERQKLILDLGWKLLRE